MYPEQGEVWWGPSGLMLTLAERSIGGMPSAYNAGACTHTKQGTAAMRAHDIVVITKWSL